MGHEEACDCGDFESSGGSVSQGWMRWLDRRNEIRTAWAVLTMQGALGDQKGLAKTVHELRALKEAGIIRTKDDLWKLVADKEKIAKHPLGRLTAPALEKFISGVQFVDYMKGGQRYQHVGVFYYGDLQREHGFTFGELFQVFALFGMGAELAVRTYDKFGWDVDYARCQPRLYYSCPWYYDC